MAVTYTESLDGPIKTLVLASAGAAEAGSSSEFNLPARRIGEAGPMVVMTEDFATGTVAVHIGLVTGKLVEYATPLGAAGFVDLSAVPSAAICQIVALDIDVTGDVEIYIG
jgi:hypothetical protein